MDEKLIDSDDEETSHENETYNRHDLEDLEDENDSHSWAKNDIDGTTIDISR